MSTLLSIPLQPIPNQSVSFMLNGSAYTVDISTRRDRLYASIWMDGAYVLHNRALVSYAPIGFDLQLADTEGLDDPLSSGLGSRWKLFGLSNE